MPDNNSCPCLAEVTDPDGLVTYVTDALLDAVFAGVLSKLKYLGVVAPFIGSPIDVAAICAAPKPYQPEWTLADFVTPQTAMNKASQLLRAKIYELNCTCLPCPPSTTCGTGTCIIVTADDGYFPDPDEQGVKAYHIDAGAGIWAARVSDGDCKGWFSGIDITWHIGGVFDPTNAVAVCNGGGTGCVAWPTVGSGFSGAVQLCFDGTPNAPVEPIPEAPDGVADWYGPPACTNSDICASLAITEERIRRIEFFTSVIAGPIYGVTAPIYATIPGGGPIEGTLADFLGRAVTALAPITPAQLISETTVNITESSFIDVTGLAYVNIAPTVVPGNMGIRGADDARIYYSNHRTPGPGWITILGHSGILGHRELLYPSGLEMVLPGTSTGLAIELSAGVEVDVTTWEREV